MTNPGEAIDGTPFDEAHETFRNELASVHADGRRKWVYARQPSGRYYRARTIVSWVLLAFLFTAPFITVNGEPLILIDVIERRFVLFGLLFWPQDFYLVVLIALTGVVALALVTTAFGRVWCGWLCPQTIFLEMVFRKIEYRVLGSAAEQVRRDRHPWVFETVWRKAALHVVFFAISFLIANLFLAYVIGVRALYTIVTDPPLQHLTGLTAITIFSLLFYGVFARFREQACTLACPYGRMMSALTDRHTITVTYDFARGEPRHRLTEAARQEGKSVGTGDCIDCGQCVTVCPTGIDIRHGIQLECVNCTACMDACDTVMARVDRPVGLIRLTSHDAVQRGRSSWLTLRVKAYAGVLTLLAGLVITLLAIRPDVDVLILRQPGTLYAPIDDVTVANFYNVQVVNRTNRLHTLEYGVIEPAGASITPLGPVATVGPHALVESRLLVKAPQGSLTGPSTPIRFQVKSDGRVIDTVESSFLGPAGARSPGQPDQGRGPQ